jgi:pimeloyl-ACP methyl ester carboxylesterase
MRPVLNRNDLMASMQKRVHLSVCLLVVGIASSAAADLRETTIPSSRDNNPQPVKYFIPEKTEGAVPLLVLLHSWSGDYRQTGNIEPSLKACRERSWALIHPNFRGPNWTPEACGSDLAVQDVLDAVDWMQQQTAIDPERIYLAGSSGGGHMAMLLAGRVPERWAGVSAWVGISDLVVWHGQTKKAGLRYFEHMERACGGAPGDSNEVDQEYRHRSPLTHLHHARGVHMDLNAGIHDGHTGSVPVSHSLHAFNLLAETNGHAAQALSEAQIEFITAQRQIPDELKQPAIEEERKRDVLFRRGAGPVRITLFDGGHEGDMPAAIRWLAEQRRERPPGETRN